MGAIAVSVVLGAGASVLLAGGGSGFLVGVLGVCVLAVAAAIRVPVRNATEEQLGRAAAATFWVLLTVGLYAVLAAHGLAPVAPWSALA
ncbi:hypothetical protein KUV85_06200 [Nocardioides panacisoli]|uniref:hypothetical protein n=1 Tax=Nocardioides panacisoli TaxID=627624 RepID=UPI001C637EED|nr:hypothetical protein [Nocardioides panacisoli]QYJ05264.1 hypothetical protein KUV85_06200 [Nocardioides panacisoli]